MGMFTEALTNRLHGFDMKPLQQVSCGFERHSRFRKGVNRVRKNKGVCCGGVEGHADGRPRLHLKHLIGLRLRCRQVGRQRSIAGIKPGPQLFLIKTDYEKITLGKMALLLEQIGAEANGS